MLRPYRGSSRPSFDLPVEGRRNKKRLLFSLGLPALLLVGLLGLGNDLSFLHRSGVRKLVIQCVHNIYAETVQAARDMPNPPSVTVGNEVPSYMGICQEWIRRTAQGTVQPTYTQEDDSVCMDAFSPHYRVMEIVASSILDRVNGYSRYRHDCYRSRTWDEAVTGFDRTTVQQLLPVARMTPDEFKVNSTEMYTQCKVCAEQYDASVDAAQLKAVAYHHCFTWPSAWEGHNYTNAIVTEPGIRGDKIIVPQNASKPNTVPLSSVWNQIRNRLGYVAKIFSNVTDAPPAEHLSGVVIYLDPTSTPLAASVYQSYFPAPVTSISILSTPLCATAILPNGQLCATYAQSLVTTYQDLYPGLQNNGFDGLAGIRFQMAASSAGLWSRMIRSKLLLCPPNSPNCLMPAASKLLDPLAGFDTYAYVLESVEDQKAIEFFNMVGHGDRATVEQLPVGDIPATVPKVAQPQLYTSTGEKVAPEMTKVNNVGLTPEGYTTGNEPPAAISQTSAAAMPDSTVYSNVAAEMPTNAENPNIYFPETEEVPTAAYAQQMKDQLKPINLNYSVENTTLKATDEMVTDADYGFSTREFTSQVNSEQSLLRAESDLRIKEMVQASKADELAAIQNGDAPPYMEMEVYCPDTTADGYPVTIHDGTVRVDKNDRIMISDGAGTVIFDKNGMDNPNGETFNIPRNLTTSLPYTFIYDPVTKKNITITGKNITINTANGVTQRDPVGILLVDNLTTPYQATLITEGGSGNLRAGNIQTKYTGTVISTGPNRADDGDVVRHGRGYAIKKMLEPGSKRTIYGWWNGFYSSQSLSASESGGSGYDGSYTYRKPAISSSDEGGVESDDRDMEREIINYLQPKEIVRRRAGEIRIKVPAEEVRLFGEARVCQNHHEKVKEAQRRAEEREASQRRQQEETPGARGETIVADPAPARRELH